MRIRTSSCSDRVAVRRPRRSLLSAFWVVIALAAAAGAHAAVIIDDWSTPQDVRTSGAANPPDPMEVWDYRNGSGILGGQRDVHVERKTIIGAVGAEIFTQFGHAQGPGAIGITDVIWDGPDNDARLPVFDGNNNVDIGHADNGLDPTGLGGIDLTCHSGTDGRIVIKARTESTYQMRLRFEVFTSASQWSSYEKIGQTNNASQMIDFEFSGFTPQGNNGTSGADFSNVGAIRMEVEGLDEDADLVITGALSNCGFDFGDAPDRRTPPINATSSFYQTLLAPAPGLQEGAHHQIGGPWLPSGPTAGANDTDAENDGQPTPGADGDDTDGYDDENAVTLPTMPYPHDGPPHAPIVCDGLEMPSATYCAAVNVANPTDQAAALVAWLDFDGGRDFDNTACDSSGTVILYGCDRAAAQLQVGDTGLHQINNPGVPCTPGGSFAAGNVPAGCAGTVVVTWNLSGLSDGDITVSDTYARFRISTDPAFKSNPRPWGYARDGEVEDYILEAGTVPVSLAYFNSQMTRNGLQLTWSTVSESENLGFWIWGDRGNGMELLTPAMIPSRAADLADPQDYSVLIPSRLAAGVSELAVFAEDVFGKQEVYGLFAPGERYGRQDSTSLIDWQPIAQQAHAREDLLRRSEAGRGQLAQAVDFEASGVGMQRIDHAALMAAGLDLRGVALDSIAVTLDGEPVSRHVHADTGSRGSNLTRSLQASRQDTRFNDDTVIDFWAEAPSQPDARYIANQVYRIQVDPLLARPAVQPPAHRAGKSPTFHMRHLRVAENNGQHVINPNDDPWFMAELSALQHGNFSNHHISRFQVDAGLMTDEQARLQVVVGGKTDMPRYPDHHVQVRVNGVLVADETFDGQVSHLIQATFPASHLRPGENKVEVRLPATWTDIVLLDSVELHYPRRLQAENGRLVVDGIAASTRLDVSGLRPGPAPLAYGWDGSQLHVLTPIAASPVGAEPVPGTASYATPARSGMAYWLSAPAQMARPQAQAAVTGLASDLLAQPADLLVIAHPAFLPVSADEPHPLNDYVNHRRAQGWTVAVHDITRIQAHFGGGMALPQALTRFLAAADDAFDYSHVLLVGGDSYDYHDYLNLGSLSFIPTVYAPTSRIRHTPSDGLLADLDGDGISDKALGRWPVRSLADLAAIVDKTLAWEQGTGGDDRVVWVSDLDDVNRPSFQAQSERMIDRLAAGWDASHIRLEEFEGNYSQARQTFFEDLLGGRTLSGFSGHGSPVMWSQQGLLQPNDLAGLDNRGAPTLIGTLACYTSYFVSPYAETVAHRWMNGYLMDGAGQVIPGAGNGAVAIHGAATLSSYQQNEVFAAAVLARQQAGDTLGEAVLAARHQAADANIHDLVTNWILLGDPTLRLEH